MTNEEIEKQAKERAEKLEETQTLGVYDNDEDLARDMGWNDGKVSGYEQGFIDGAKWGTEHEWHDLREDSKDLPKENGRYWGFYDYGLRYREIFWSDNQFDITGVIAWCELPQFKE